MSNPPPSAGTALAAVARLAWLRATRGALPAVACVLAALPVVSVAAVHEREPLDTTMLLVQLLLAVLPALFVAPAIGEEIEDRTATYLWSRPLARWTILAGKLLALAPLAAAFLTGAWVAAGLVGGHELLAARPIAAVAGGTLAVSIAVAGIATILPRHGMAFAIVYMLLDMTLSGIPASIHLVSLTYATRSIAGLTDSGAATGAIGLVIIAALWLAIALRRIRRLEL